MAFRALLERDVDVVALNDLTDTETLANLLKYDSVHQNPEFDVGYDEHNLFINGVAVPVFSEKDPANLPWADYDIDVVVESTGFFRSKALASKHLEAGARKVVISAPAKGEDPVLTIVKGVNEHLYDGEKIVSNASCTTNCLAPMAKVLHDNYGIEKGLMTTVHSYTGSQNLIDGPHKDLRRGRSAAVNIVPTTTGAANAVGLVIPSLKGKLDGMAIRVPTPDGSITDFTAKLKQDVTVDEVNELYRNVAENHLQGILQYSEEPLVSADIIDNPHSVIIDADSTKVMEGNLVKVVGWYDNEWGYSNRIADLVTEVLR